MIVSKFDKICLDFEYQDLNVFYIQVEKIEIF